MTQMKTSIIPHKLKRLYDLYYYCSPIPVLSTGETIIFNLINLTILLVSAYYAVYFLPTVLTRAIEKLWFYITGQIVIVNSFFPFALSNSSQIVGASKNFTG
ncbi:uncharacterized protein SPAPADRAFT_63213 [Spathaspora passalidarum NRRL Y-27907]|uniref:Uncharacterized protein n=1 Tax=Spathaspora passalidarum (strain NRRL Y-27907 / 11-Y1) TaxID=619300 RepID=G3ATY8_SPAPN|nr:uncharacterized protein SPAPADRAFT_63213 [Spathaspora passalidarum NRRL Y-27907]EGW30364.1 hypothetical protein SPAPADRAFT_63213 [Spathaspora passalidarum NRRL Y-27907]